MVIIHNSDLTNELKEGAKLQQLNDIVPNILSNQVVPVMEVNPKLLRRINYARDGTSTNSTGGTLVTTPADKDLFITSIILSFSKDATATSLFSGVTCIINGLTVSMIKIATLTLTAERGEIAIDFNSPIKPDRNTAIRTVNSTNAANVVCCATILGYTVDNPNA